MGADDHKEIVTGIDCKEIMTGDDDHKEILISGGNRGIVVAGVQGVVTSATSLIEALVKKNPEEYKGCVSLAVSRLSRVSEK